MAARIASAVTRFVATLALAVLLTCPAPAATCETCRLHLTTRTGPYLIILSKETMSSTASAARIAVTVVNKGSRAIVLGSSSPSAHILLNSVTPRARGTEVVRAVPVGRSERISPGSSWTFHVVYPYRLGRPGTYKFNVSFGGVDSNILTYLVR